MSRFLIGNLYLAVSMLCTAGSQVMFKMLIDDVRPDRLTWSEMRRFLTPRRLVRAGVASVIVVLGFVTWVQCLARLELSYAYPAASASVLLVALFSAVFLGEPVTRRIWLGTALILLGVVLLAP